MNDSRFSNGDADWLSDAARDGKNNLIANLANTLICLRGVMELSGCFGFNEMTRSVELVEELPVIKGTNGASTGKLPRPVIDADIAQVCECLQRAYKLHKIGINVVHQAVDRRAREYRFHPLRDWLNDLRWDGVSRVARLFAGYFGAEDSIYTQSISKIFLISMVARVFVPGCQADYVPIFVGQQGILKSTALAALAGEAYFGDHLPDIRTKESSQYLRGKWLVELPELAALNKGDIELWKAFITRRSEQYRPPWAHFPVDEPRQCIFAGTTNQEEFLRDTTGNRRFLPVATPKDDVDITGLKHDRAMLLAEAVSLYKSGEKWWPDRAFEREHIAPRQEERVEIDVWEQPIAEWLGGGLNGEPVLQATSFEIMQGALHIGAERVNPADGRRVANIMRKRGWAQNKKSQHRPWTRP
jgi:predicted P-loop ATPase